MNIWKKSEDAVVGVVVAVLLVGLVVSVVSLIQTVYVPSLMEEKEAEHMERVGDQFTQLKFAIDNQIANKQVDVPIATSITLGSKELPFFLSLRAFGSLEIISNATAITVSNGTNSFTYDLGVIMYSSANGYFIDQSYIYESGSVITHQSLGSMMLIRPSFKVVSIVSGPYGDDVNMTFVVVNVEGVGRKTSTVGYGTIPIQTEYVESNITSISDVKYINITTEYPEAWHVFINNSLQSLPYPLIYNLDYLIIDSGKEVNVEFIGSSRITTNLNFFKIAAQIGPGWVETG